MSTAHEEKKKLLIAQEELRCEMADLQVDPNLTCILPVSCPDLTCVSLVSHLTCLTLTSRHEKGGWLNNCDDANLQFRNKDGHGS